MSLLTQQDTAAHGAKTEAAWSEYVEILRRRDSPQPGDLDALSRCRAILGFETSDTRAHEDILDQAAALAAQVPSDERDKALAAESQAKCRAIVEKVREAYIDWIRGVDRYVLRNLLTNNVSDLSNEMFQLIRGAIGEWRMEEELVEVNRRGAIARARSDLAALKAVNPRLFAAADAD